MRWPLALLPLALLAPAPGCGDRAPGQVIGETTTQALPPIKVDLPPPPPFTPPDVPERYPDGAFSVYGVRKQIEKNLGQELSVKAFMLEVYQCPVCPKEIEKQGLCPKCDQPHFWLSDKAEGRREKALLVVDYPTKPPLVEKPPQFAVGQPYSVRGTFQRGSLSGFGASDGLIVHHETRDATGNVVVSGSSAETFGVRGDAALTDKLPPRHKR